VIAPTGRTTPDSGTASRGADATSDGVLSEVGTVAEDGPGGSEHRFVPFPAPADALYETVPAANYQPALDQYPEPEEHDSGSAADQCEPVTPLAPLSVAGDRSAVVAAAVSAPSVSTDGPRPSGSLRRRPAVRLLMIGLLALALGATAVGANLLDPVDATSVVAEPADSSGEDSFTPPPTPGDGASEPTPPAGGGSVPGTDGGALPEDVRVSGDTGGLYGGTGADACSAASMARFLDDHPDRAAAWARAQGIEPSDIRSFLKSLTPVVLRTDTAVTNHGFRDGRANAYQATLQAGTAVMVDEYGVPRVRCACGNPLDGPGSRDQIRYTGVTWSELGRRAVTVIGAAPAVVEQFVVLVVQEDATVVVDRLPGTDGDHDEPATPEVVEAALDFSVEDPANAAESGEDAVEDGSAGSGEEPATDGSAGSGGESATDGSAGTRDQAATDGSAGTGDQPATDGAVGTGDQPATDGSTGTGEEAAAGDSAGSGGS
jgi:hypothetical protein